MAEDAGFTAQQIEHYQLFLMAKRVTGDIVLAQNQSRTQLSPTPEIDAVWHAHMLRPHSYIAMCKVLLERVESSDPDMPFAFLGHYPEAARDSERKKKSRIAKMKLAFSRIVVEESVLAVTGQVSSLGEDGCESKKRPRMEEAMVIITLGVRDAADNVIFFKTKSTTKMEKIFEAYAARIGKSVQDMNFIFDGNRIVGTYTPEQIGLEDEGYIRALISQSGC